MATSAVRWVHQLGSQEGCQIGWAVLTLSILAFAAMKMIKCQWWHGWLLATHFIDFLCFRPLWHECSRSLDAHHVHHVHKQCAWVEHPHYRIRCGSCHEQCDSHKHKKVQSTTPHRRVPYRKLEYWLNQTLYDFANLINNESVYDLEN